MSEITEGTRVLVQATYAQTRSTGYSTFDVLDFEGRTEPPRVLLDHPHPPYVPLDDLREVLGKCEWGNGRPENVYCPVCNVAKYRSGTPGDDNDHAPDCKLAALLALLGDQ